MLVPFTALIATLLAEVAFYWTLSGHFTIAAVVFLSAVLLVRVTCFDQHHEDRVASAVALTAAILVWWALADNPGARYEVTAIRVILSLIMLVLAVTTWPWSVSLETIFREDNTPTAFLALVAVLFAGLALSLALSGRLAIATSVFLTAIVMLRYQGPWYLNKDRVAAPCFLVLAILLWWSAPDWPTHIKLATSILMVVVSVVSWPWRTSG